MAYAMNTVQNRRVFTTLDENQVLFYGDGKRDSFCTYLGQGTLNEQTGLYESVCVPVKDELYFPILRELYDRYGEDVWVKHIIGIYNQVKPYVRKDLVSVIRETCEKTFSYEEDRKKAFRAYLMMYYGMVAEENVPTMGNQRPVCGKAMKLMGLYKYLIQRMPLGTPSNPGACQCFIGKRPQDVLTEAAEYGIYRDFAVYRLQ